MRSIEVVEGEEFSLSKLDAEHLRDAAERLQVQLRPSFSLLSERAGRFRISNVVGTIDLGGGTVLQVRPKVAQDDDWVTAVVSLLTGKESIDVAGERRAGSTKIHNSLLDAIAGVYTKRLERAYRQEGPIVLMERTTVDLPYLHGKLDATRWARSALWRPHIFPVSRTALAQDNPFTRGLLQVADLLAHSSSNYKIRNGLHALARDLSAGIPRAGAIPDGLTSRPLPEQWSAYKPAWSLAVAILTRTSLFGPSGRHSGIGLAVEAWPLLETLLARTLQAMERVGRGAGRVLSQRVQGNVPLLLPIGSPPQTGFSPSPDGRLFESGKLLATFEAKYSVFDGTVPSREHIYQSLTTAAACAAPVAVLVYPTTFEPKVWEVVGLNGQPRRLVAIGLSLFKWTPTVELDDRAAKLLKLIDQMNSVNQPATSMAVTA